MLLFIFCILLSVAVFGLLLSDSPSHCPTALTNDSLIALFFTRSSMLYMSPATWSCGSSYTIELIGFVKSLIFIGYHLFFRLWFLKLSLFFRNASSSMKMFHPVASLTAFILNRLRSSCSVLWLSSIMFINDCPHRSVHSYANPVTAIGILFHLVSGTS